MGTVCQVPIKRPIGGYVEQLSYLGRLNVRPLNLLRNIGNVLSPKFAGPNNQTCVKLLSLDVFTNQIRFKKFVHTINKYIYLLFLEYILLLF